MCPDPNPGLLSSRPVFDGRLIRVRIDRLRFSDGSEGDREIVDHPGAVVIAAVDAANRVALARQYRHPVGDRLVELPAGTLEEGESPLTTAKRELREEAGLIAERWDSLGSFYSSPGFLKEELHAFLARDLEPTAQDLEADEDIEISWRNLSDLSRPNNGLHDAKTLATILLAQAHITGEAEALDEPGGDRSST